MLGEQTLLSFEQSNVKMLHYGIEAVVYGQITIAPKTGA